MKLRKIVVLTAAVAFGALAFKAFAADSAPASGGKKPMSDAEKEKLTAQQNPYPNDDEELAPDHLDAETLKSYPENIQEGYYLLRGEDKTGKQLVRDGKKITNCQTCHTARRPLNSRFVQPEAKNDPALREAAVAKLKKEQPDLFTDKTVWEIDATMWSRYVKRMMGKPGCNISAADGKKIFEFLVYDSVHRKLGANAEKWKAHRHALVEKFKKDHPDRYAILAKDNDL